MKYFSEFNEFCNLIIDIYSYKITRDEASKKLIKDETIYINNKNNFKDKFNKFKNIWTHLKSYSTQYGCREQMPSIDLDENKSISYFLNDNGEIGKGMYIASAYQNFIEWHNNFLNIFIEPLKQKGISINSVKSIDIQNATKSEIINFEEIDKLLLELIYENSKRNIFKEDNSINYHNYKQIIYNFDSIEENLGKILLQYNVKFNDHEKLRFVTFCYEGFRNNKSSNLSDFIQKYQQIELNEEEKKNLYSYIKDKLNNKIDDLLKILFSIQLLINYLTQEKDEKKGDLIKIIEELPNNIILSDECIEFVKNQKIQVEKLFDVFSYFELLCFKPIINNLKDNYKLKIDENFINNINKLFEEKKFSIITKNNLASACRKLISRYLVGTRNDVDINEENKLDLYLNREEI